MSESVRHVVICGNWGGSNIAQSLYQAAADTDGLEVAFCDSELSASRFAIVNKLLWRLDKMTCNPRRLEHFIRAEVTEGSCVITTGLTHVRAAALRGLREMGCATVHYSTDDPWNPAQRANWHHRALPEYSIVYTPRLVNIAQFKLLGCRDVRYLPFGFDHRHFPDTAMIDPATPVVDTLFVGGADDQRASFFRAYTREGGRPTFVGGYWNRWNDLDGSWLGHLPPCDVLALSLAARINIILVRHANRDGHTMRSIEAGAIGCCLLVEDTREHRKIFGDDGECVRYFSSPNSAATIARELLEDERERQRMAQAVKLRMRSSGYSYADRLQAILRDTEAKAAISKSRAIL